ncbi:hypothetical protein PAPYR_9408 [Paratrimastix pyriformis]|uniref:Protein kinase domain-containing protein n=1 Tax=Paratrimastix pyriformis TaxID=342808 RepID=A0ABQ8UB22_9EUKA|nr:hypothetical protein PAPYR_9408 [Paratrimastix pyriformis]
MLGSSYQLSRREFIISEWEARDLNLTPATIEFFVSENIDPDDLSSLFNGSFWDLFPGKICLGDQWRLQRAFPNLVPISAPAAPAAAPAAPRTIRDLLQALVHEIKAPSSFNGSQFHKFFFDRNRELYPVRLTQHGMTPFPAELVHPAFMKFTSLFYGTAAPDASMCAAVTRLAQLIVMATASGSEGALYSGEFNVTPVLEDLLQMHTSSPGASAGPIDQSHDDESRPDLLADMISGKPAVIFDIKRALDSGALGRLAGYYARLWLPRPNGACPTFLVQGPYFSVSAAFATAKGGLVIEELSPFVGVMPYRNPAALQPALRLFWALREALAELEMTHRIAAPPCPPSSQDPFFFAASDLKGLGQLEIVSRMGGQCFKARIIPSKTAGGVAAALPVALKIVAGDYGVAAHQAAFVAGFAPALVACYQLPSLDPIPIRPHPAPASTVSPLLLAAINSAAAAATAATAATSPSHVLVIMEDLTDFRPWYALDPDLRLALAGPLKDAVARLHAEGWVHGDLRDINVGATMAPAPRLVIIDYDWSGPVGVATYPLFLNHEIGWPEGAVSGGLITREHDDDWVEQLTFVARV